MQDKKIKNLEIYLKNMYKGIIPEKSNRGYYDPIDYRFLNDFIEDPLQIKIHNFHRTRIDKLSIDDGYPVEWKDENGKTIFVQLRKIDKEKLLLGCGNNPTSISYHYPIDKDFEKECFSYFEDVEYAKIILKQLKDDLNEGHIHTHNEYITIDPNLAMNPTIVGFFGWYKIPEELIPSNSLKEINSEGIILEGLKNYEEDFLRLTGNKKIFYKDIAYEK